MKARHVPARSRELAALLLAFAFVPSLAQAAPPAPQQDEGAHRAAAAPSQESVLAAAREIMAAARYCDLVTVAEDGRPQARIVDPFAPEDDFTVWAATRPMTRKVAQIRAHPQATLLWFDRESLSYVTLLGDAELVDDPAEKAARWKPEWAGFYEDENRGDDYLLIRVRPRRIEVVSFGRGIESDPVTWLPTAVDFP